MKGLTELLPLNVTTSIADPGRKYLFNDTLNRCYLWLYGVKLIVKDHPDCKREKLLPFDGQLFSISSTGSFIRTIPRTGEHIPWPLLCSVQHWLEQEIAQWVHNSLYHEQMLFHEATSHSNHCLGDSNTTDIKHYKDMLMYLFFSFC